MNDPAASPPMVNHTISITASPITAQAMRATFGVLCFPWVIARPRQGVELPARGEDDRLGSLRRGQ